MEADRRPQMRIGFREVQGRLIGLDVVKIPKQFQILSKTGRLEGLLERILQMCLQFIRLALHFRTFFINSVEIIAEHPEGAVVFGSPDPGDDCEGLVNAPGFSRLAWFRVFWDMILVCSGVLSGNFNNKYAFQRGAQHRTTVLIKILSQYI